jgi:uncharacterized membrane protein YgdD (TMEM256/DUF423 family)
MTNHTLQKSMFQSGCVFAGTSVILGAFGAHALKDVLDPSELATFETGVRYQFMHAIGILTVSLSLRKLKEKTARNVWYMFIFGILVFSLSLYLLATRNLLGFSEQFKFIGAFTPLGGLSFIGGWAYLAYDGFKLSNEEHHSGHKHRTHSHSHTSDTAA